MRIGFDVSPLHRPHPRGIVRVVSGLAGALERRARHEIVRLEPPPGANLVRWRQLVVPAIARRERLDGVHSCLSSFPFLRLGSRGGRRVQTIHELPWLAGEDENADVRHRAWAAVGPLVADRVVTATERTARDIRAWSPLAARKVRVCPWGVDAVFVPGRLETDARFLARFGLGSAPFVVCPGAVRKKKNLAAALRGLARVRDDRLRLVVTGERTSDLVADLVLAQELGLGTRVVSVGDVDDDALAALLRNASVALVLSRSEGFALPVVEAQACGTPVIVPAGSTQAEVAGDAGVRVDADDPDSVARGLEDATSARGTAESIAEFSADAGSIANAARFTWSRCAELVERVWEELA